MTPDCFPSRLSYLDWVHTARMHPPAPGHESCEDCTFEYQSQMIRQGRCQYPGTTFKQWGEGRDLAIVGRRPYHVVHKLKQVAIYGVG